MKIPSFGDPYDQVIKIFGILYLSKALFTLLGGVFKQVRKAFPPDLQAKYGKNSWALITGSSDGIGKAFAEQLAKRGFNIILLARNKQKLEKVASELKVLNKNIQTKIITVDLAKSCESGFFDPIYEEIKDIDISILVNNAGFDIMLPFHTTDEKELRDLLTVNIFPYVLLTRKLINNLRSRKPRSAVINVSSAAAIAPLPYFTVYGGTKIFEDHFTKSLQIEYPEIDFISLRPNAVSTKANLYKEDPMETITPEQCAEGTLRDLGRYVETEAHIKHEISAWGMVTLPSFVLNFATKNIIIPKEWERRRKILEKEADKKK